MTIYLSNRDGNGKTSEEGHYKFQTSIWSGNFLGAEALKVVQNNPLAMTVLVQSGQYKIDTGSDYSYTGWNTASLPITIATADAANPRITSIVIYVDKAASTSPSPPNNPNITKIIAVNGSPAASPTAPNSTALQSAVGAGNPYIVIANVTVPASATQIVNANISDQRVQVRLSDDIIKGSNIELRSNPAAYPIGSIYINASVNTNPSVLLGFGTWVAFGGGRVPVGFDASDTDFNAAEKTGGTKTVTLTEPQLPNIAGSWTIHGQEGGTVFYNKTGYATGSTYGGGYKAPPGTSGGAYSQATPGFNFGQNQAHPNMQPFITVYMWKRTA